MKEIQLGSHKAVMYDDISEIPMKRFHRFNKMMLVDSGIGSDLNDVDKHLEKIKAYILTKKPDQAIKEIENLRTNIYFIGQNLCPKYLAFASLLKELDGEPCEDLSDDGLQKIVDKLSDVEIPTLNQEFEEVKKKIDDDLVSFFPALFDEPTVKEFYDKIRKRTLAILKGIISGNPEEYKDEIEKITLELITYSDPSSFSGQDNAEVEFDRQFERMCHIISYHLNVSPKNYTVTEFYSAFEYIKEIIKANKITPKKIRK